MRLVCTSDTHMRHDALRVSEADVLVHAGDFSRHGTKSEAVQFLEWLGAQPAARKLLTPGNHDLCCEEQPDWFEREAAARGIDVLVDSGIVIDGVRFWGSPATPRFRNMAYNRERGAEIAAHWAKIPRGIDVLVTHGPPRQIGDRMFLGAHVGCADLRERVEEIAPAVHVFGHIHEGFGEYSEPRLATRFYNVACARFPFRGQREAVSIEL